MNSIETFAERNGLVPIKPRFENEPELQPNAKAIFGVGNSKLRDFIRSHNLQGGRKN